MYFFYLHLDKTIRIGDNDTKIIQWFLTQAQTLIKNLMNDPGRGENEIRSEMYIKSCWKEKWAIGKIAG